MKTKEKKQRKECWPLQYKLSLISSSEPSETDNFTGLKIDFEDRYFTKAVRLTSLQQFPKKFISTFQYQCHSNFILFYGASADAKILGEQIQKILSSMKVMLVSPTTLHEGQRFQKITQFVDVAHFSGVKLFRNATEDYQPGDMLIYYLQESHNEALHMKIIAKNYFHSIVYYSLESIIIKEKIPGNYIRETFREVIQHYMAQFFAQAKLFELHLDHMGVCKRVVQKKRQWFLGMKIQGNRYNIHEFYINFEHVINTIPLQVISLHQIKSLKLQKIHENLPETRGIVLLDPSTLLIMDREIDAHTLINKLHFGSHFIGLDTFTQDQFVILEKQCKNKRLQTYLKQNQIFYQSISVTLDRLIIRCDSRILHSFLKVCHQYLCTCVVKEFQCTELPNSKFINIFMKYYKQKVEKQFYVEFNLKEGKLWRRNYMKDDENLSLAISYWKDKLKRNYSTIPSLKPVSQYLSEVNKFSGMYDVQINPPSFDQKFLPATKIKVEKILISLSSFLNLVDYQESLVYIIHDDLPKNAEIFRIASETEIKMQRFYDGLKGTKPCRIQKYLRKNSTQFESITLIYFDIKKISLNKIDSDIQNLLKSSEAKKMNFIIGPESKRMVQEIIPRLLNSACRLSNSSQIKIEQLSIFYQDPSILPLIERIIFHFRAEAKLLTKGFFDAWAILKIKCLNYYILSYYWNKQTLTLSGLNSFFFQYELSKKSKSKSVVSIPKLEDYEYSEQLILNLRFEIVYRFFSPYQIHEFQLSSVSAPLQKFVEVIKYYFPNLEYLVVFAKKTAQVGKQLCLNLYYRSEKNENTLQPLSINLEMKKIRSSNSPTILFAVTKKQYVEQFAIHTHKLEFENLINSFEK